MSEKWTIIPAAAAFLTAAHAIPTVTVFQSREGCLIFRQGRQFLLI
jgi:hypothetical protein